jgi:hypothetical protein
MRKILSEGLDYHDLANQVIPEISIDEYAAKMGDDDDVVTVAFTVKGKQVGEDLTDWFERGYDFVLDAQVSDGEITPDRYLVFVELDRRNNVPNRVCELIDDLETLTGLKPKEWTITIDKEDYDADPDQLRSALILSPHLYRQVKEKDLNEMRELSGLDSKKIYGEPDTTLKDFLSKAGL